MKKYKLDVVIHDNEKGICMLINAVISEGINVIKKEAEQIVKDKDFTIEIECTWNVKTNVIRIIIVATGTVLRSCRKYLNNITGKHEIKKQQKTAILGTAYNL